MPGHMVQVLAAAALMVLLSEVPTGAGECCGVWYHYGYISRWVPKVRRCPDCTQPEGPWGVYCGAHGGGGCNIFGCNCGGGCKQPVPGRACSLECCDDPPSRQDRRPRRQVTSDAIYTPTSNYTGHDVIIAGDLDKDGHLDGVEVHLYATLRGLPVNDVTAWLELDSNGDGKLTAAEIDNDLHDSVDDLTPV